MEEKHEIHVKMEIDDEKDSHKTGNKKKEVMISWSREKKLAKLSIYSPCRSLKCNCSGWKSPRNRPSTSNANEIIEVYMDEPCKFCSHALGIQF